MSDSTIQLLAMMALMFIGAHVMLTAMQIVQARHDQLLRRRYRRGRLLQHWLTMAGLVALAAACIAVLHVIG